MSTQAMKGSLDEQLVRRYSEPGLIAGKSSEERVARYTQDRLPLLTQLQRSAANNGTYPAGDSLSMPYALRSYHPGRTALSHSLEQMGTPLHDSRHALPIVASKSLGSSHTVPAMVQAQSVTGGNRIGASSAVDVVVGSATPTRGAVTVVRTASPGKGMVRRHQDMPVTAKTEASLTRSASGHISAPSIQRQHHASAPANAPVVVSATSAPSAVAQRTPATVVSSGSSLLTSNRDANATLALRSTMPATMLGQSATGGDRAGSSGTADVVVGLATPTQGAATVVRTVLPTTNMVHRHLDMPVTAKAETRMTQNTSGHVVSPANAPGIVSATSAPSAVAQRTPATVVSSGSSLLTSNRDTSATLALRSTVPAAMPGQAVTGGDRTGSSGVTDVVSVPTTPAKEAATVMRTASPGKGMLQRHLDMPVTAKAETRMTQNTSGHAAPSTHVPVVGPQATVRRTTQITASDSHTQDTAFTELWPAPVVRVQPTPNATDVASLQQAGGMAGPFPIVTRTQSQIAAFSDPVPNALTQSSSGHIPSATSQPGASLMPKLKYVQQRAGNNLTTKSLSGAALPEANNNHFLQRLATGASDTSGTSQTVSAPVVSADTQTNVNRNGSGAAPDLERLANEVYAIIEQRITIERESLGL